jgi:hypothetical protein
MLGNNGKTLRAWKGAGWKCNPGITLTLLGMSESVKEWEHTFNELPLWELESLQNFESLKNDFKGQNSLDWRVPYINENILRLRCLKWFHTTHLSIYNKGYDQKKSWESKCQLDSHPLKVKNCFELHVCRWCATYYWNLFDKGYNFALNFILIKGLHKKLRTSKMLEVLISRISRLPTWES